MMQERLRAQLGGQAETMRQTAMQGPSRALPHQEALQASFGDALGTLRFFGGTPEAQWACAALGVSGFSHDGAIVTAEENPSLEKISHEVTHALQGAGGPVSGVAGSGSAAEQEATGAGRAVAGGEPVQVTGSAPAGTLHGYPGLLPIPIELPIPNPLSGIVEHVVREVVDTVVDAVVSEVTATVDDIIDGFTGVIDDIGEGLSDAWEGAQDALGLRENEDLLDIEEDIDAGELDAPRDAIGAVFAVLRKQRAGEEVSAEERAEAADAVNALDNAQMRQLLHALDAAGLLMEATQAVFGGTPAEGESDMYEVPVAAWRFWNASDDIEADVQRANEIYEPHSIHIQSVGSRNITKSEVEGIVGHTVPNAFGLDRSKSDGTFTDADMVAVVGALGVGQIISGLWVPTVVNDSGTDLSGTSMHTENMTHNANIAFVATDHSGADTFAHELGHILTREGHVSGDTNNLMNGGGTRDKDAHGDDRLTDEQVEDIRGDVLGYLRS